MGERPRAKTSSVPVPFFDAEGVSHTVVVGGDGDDEIALPLLVHEIDDSGQRDAFTPYGYPGATILNHRRSPPDPAALDWSQTGLVSIFVRDRIGHEPCLKGATGALGGPGPRPGARAADPLTVRGADPTETTGSATTSKPCTARTRRSSSG